jgi:hypothetical protein
VSGSGVIGSQWLALAPAARMDAGFWLAVLDMMRERGIDPATATDAQVREAISHLEQERHWLMLKAAWLASEASLLNKAAASLRQAAKL